MSSYKLIDDATVLSQAKTLKNRGYKILTKINEGSYAKVYLGEFQSPALLVTKLAVKIVDENRGPRDFSKKFLPRELSILAQIDHPHIIHIHSILQVGKKIYIFMRFAEQGDLLEFLLKFGAINEAQARVWIRQIALAVQYLHELNIAHRDLKCENILVTMNFNIKLSDFGFARYTVDTKEKPVLSETYCGTLLYASPEILHGHPYNPQIADLWSIGVMLYVMLNKTMPFTDDNARLLYKNQMNRNYKFRSSVVNVLSNEVKQLIQGLLEPDPAERLGIKNIIKSNWIMMDERLIELSPYESAALAFAMEHHYLPPANIKMPYFKYKRKQEILGDISDFADQPVTDVGVIKAYTDDDKPRISDDTTVERFPILKFTDPPILNID